MANQIAYGFFNLADVFAQRVTEIGVSVVADAIQASVDEHNRQLAALTALFVRPTTDFKTRYRTPSVARLQPLDETGRARPIRLAGYYDVSWPIQMGGAAWGGTFVSQAKMTVQEANEYTNALLSADRRWMRDHILAGLYDNTTWSFADEEHGALTIQPLANGDTVKYTIMAGADDGATDTHFLAQAGAIADNANPFPTIYTELMEHPENSGEVVSFIPSNLKATVSALTNFEEEGDPDITPGASTAQLTGSLDVATPGNVIGKVDKCWIVEWRSMPDDRIISVTTDGEAPLGMREDVEESLRGFRQVATRNDHPFSESHWMRRAGFGAWNRVGAVVYLIGNASYSIPTGYTNPIP